MRLISRVRLCLGLLAAAFLISVAPASAAYSPVVISQFRVHDPNGDAHGGDFVEITNISNSTVNLGTGWSISWLDPTGNNACTIVADYTNNSPGPYYIIRPPLSLAPGQRYLLTQPGNWSGTGDAASDESFHGNAGANCSAIPTAGVLTLTIPDPNNYFGPALGTDSVAFGPIPGDDGVPPGNQGTVTLTEQHSFKPVPLDGRAMRRLNSGTQDNDNNKFDFQAVTADPKNSLATATAPNVTTNDPTSVAARSATLNATANPHRAVITDCHFQIDASAAYSNPTTVACSPVTPAGQTDLPITGAATGLTPSAPGQPSVYHYRLVVTTNKGTTIGNDKTVTTTLPDPPPGGTTDAATIVNAASATLNGTINVHGGTVSDCHFDYGKSSSFGLQTPCTTTPTGTNSVAVTAPVIDLDPSSDYVYRLVVTTENGTFTGSTNVPFHTTALAPADTDKIVISQFRTRGSGGDFVELANVTGSTLTMQAGWSLGASTVNGGCSVITSQSGPQVTLAPGQHYLVGGITGADLGFASGAGRCNGNLPDTDAMLSLFAIDASNSTLLTSDSAAYGSYLSASEGPSELIVPSDGKALRRRANGTQDTHRNADDFTVVTASPTGLAGSAPSPVVTTGTSTALLQTTATLNGTVNPKGGAVTNCHFDYGTTASYGSSVPCATTPSGTTASAVTAALTSLSPSNDYHAQLVVTTGAGTVTGGDVAFRTADPLPVPTGSTDDATKVAAATATLKASVNPHGAGVSDCHFDFGTTTSYGTSVPCSTTPTGSNSAPVSAPVTDLLASQAYHYRIRVTGDNGSLTGLDKSFTTNAVVPDNDKVVITQFRTRGVANGDYAELLNVSDDTVELTAGGWSMSYLTPDGNNSCVIVSFNNAPAVTLAPGQHYLVTQSGWTGTGTSAGDLTFYTGGGGCGDVPDGSGILGFSGGGTGDSVAYGTLNGATANEPDPISAVPSDGKALERRDSGARDTGNNYDDFHAVTASPKNFFASPPPASVTSDPATNVGSAKATFQGRVRPAGETITGCQFKYGTDAEFASGTPYPHTVACSPATPTGTGTVPVSAAMTGLTPSTGYHYQLVAHGNIAGDVAGTDQQLTTSAPPSATTGAATSIGSRSATANATVNPRGEAVTNCHFDYGTDTNYGSSAPCSPTTPSGSGDVPVTGALTGMSPSTGYHVRIHITTSVAGERTGDDQTFTTTTTPSATTSDATGVGHTSATLHGTVDPKGETVTNCHFEYGTDTNYGSSVACQSTPTGIGDSAVSAPLTSLASTTGYHYRLVVTTNGSPGTPVAGGDQQFTTSTPPAITTDDFTAVGSRSATLNGTLSPHGDGLTACRFEYSTDTSFASSVPCTPATQFSGVSDVPVSAVLTGLQPSTDYNVRVFVSSGSLGPMTSVSRTLSTTTTPSATSDPASSVSHRSATLNGTVAPHGETVTDCHFEYGTDTSYGSTAPCSPSSPSGTTPSPVSADVSGLTPGTTYHSRVVITTDGSATPVDAADSQFTTADPATDSTDTASAVAARSATLNGTVTPNGETISGCHFEYGTDTSYGSTVPCSGASAALSGLTPSTTTPLPARDHHRRRWRDADHRRRSSVHHRRPRRGDHGLRLRDLTGGGHAQRHSHSQRRYHHRLPLRVRDRHELRLDRPVRVDVRGGLGRADRPHRFDRLPLPPGHHHRRRQ